MEIILEVKNEDLEDEMDVAPAIYFNILLNAIQKHLEEHVDKVTIKKTWRELHITLNGKPGKQHDFLKKEAQKVLEEVETVFGIEDLGGWVRNWGTNDCVEMYIRYRRS